MMKRSLNCVSIKNNANLLLQLAGDYLHTDFNRKWRNFTLLWRNLPITQMVACDYLKGSSLLQLCILKRLSHALLHYFTLFKLYLIMIQNILTSFLSTQCVWKESAWTGALFDKLPRSLSPILPCKHRLLGFD